LTLSIAGFFEMDSQIGKNQHLLTIKVSGAHGKATLQLLYSVAATREFKVTLVQA